MLPRGEACESCRRRKRVSAEGLMGIGLSFVF